jgi:hypothetical protein
MKKNKLLKEIKDSKIEIDKNSVILDENKF